MGATELLASLYSGRPAWSGLVTFCYVCRDCRLWLASGRQSGMFRVRIQARRHLSTDGFLTYRNEMSRWCAKFGRHSFLQHLFESIVTGRCFTGEYQLQDVEVLHSAYTVYLCLCGSEDRQRLFHCRALTDWFL